MRIIHIVENLNKGAVENWLVNVFIESRKTKPGWEWTFYCMLGNSGRLDEQVRQAGGNIIYAPCTVSSKIRFLQALRKTLKVGKYDIIHCHHDYLSGFYLLATYRINFKKRILHIHNNDAALPVGNKLLHNVLLKPFRWLGIHFSDVIVGISNDTLQQFVKGAKLEKKQTTILYYGIDLKKFEKITDRTLLRQQLNLPIDSIVLLFSGRMNRFKNPVFVVDILNELLKYDKNYHSLFVGEGYLTKDVINKAAAFGISENVHIVGWRNDLADVMKSSDTFVFPRVEYPKEGLGLVVVEAQAAALPLFLSNGIVADAVEIPELVHFIQLNNNPSVWAQAIQKSNKKISAIEALERMKMSRFSLPIATQNLLNLYA